MGTVMQRPAPNVLLEVVRAGDVLVATALDWLGHDTRGLPELINQLATMGVDLNVLDMPVEAQDVAGAVGGSLWSPPEWRPLSEADRKEGWPGGVGALPGRGCTLYNG